MYNRTTVEQYKDGDKKKKKHKAINKHQLCVLLPIRIISV